MPDCQSWGYLGQTPSILGISDRLQIQVLLTSLIKVDAKCQLSSN